MSVDCKGRVLVVEDQPRFRVELEKLFRALGYIVKSAEGEEQELLDSARRTAREFRPHVTIMDLELLTKPPHRGDRSGVDLIDDPDFALTRCIVYTAHYKSNPDLVRDLVYKPNVDDVMARNEVERLVNAVQKSFKHRCACLLDQFEVRWPNAWGVGRIAEAIFGTGSGVSPDVIVDVLGRLFPDGAKPLRLSPLYGGAAMAAAVARSRSVLLDASLPTRRPFAIKLAPRDRIVKEVGAYKEHIDQSLDGNFYVESRYNAAFWDAGAIHYSFVGARQLPLKSLSAFYQQEPDPANVLKPLRHFFGEAWRPHYSDSRSRLDDTLFDAYDRARGLRQPLDALRAEGRTLPPGLPPELPDPVEWVFENETDSGTFAAHGAVTHGDLHGDNLFVEADHAWAIDFEQSGPGPILRDFVELERDIVTRLMPSAGDDAEEFFRFALALTTPRTPKEALPLPDQPRPSAELKKAAEVVAGLRALAADVTGFKDMREYYWGLLLVSLLCGSTAHRDASERGRAMLLAAVAASRLEHWLEQWPPGWARRWPGRGRDGGDDAGSRPAPGGETETEYDVFVSYNRDDLVIVQRLVERLRADGVDVWYDRDLNPGDRWLPALEARPQQSRVCIVCYGPSGLSEWQKTELSYALAHGVAKKLILVPVLLPGGGSAEEVRGFASLNQVSDLKRGLDNSEDEIQKLIRVILAARLGKPPREE